MLSTYLNKATIAFVGVLAVFSVLSGLYVWKLRGDVDALTEDKVELQAQAASLTGIVAELRLKSLEHTKLNIKQSEVRTKTSSKLRSTSKALQKETQHDVFKSTAIANPVELDRLRQLVHEANAGITSSAYTK